jgi:hypothetical protein
MVKQIEVGREYRVLSNDAYVPAGSTALVIRIVEETGLPLCRIETKAGVRLVALTLCSLDEQVGEPVSRHQMAPWSPVRVRKKPYASEHAARIASTWTAERREAHAQAVRDAKGSWRQTMPDDVIARIQQLHRSGIGCRRLAQQFNMPKYRIDWIVKEALV